jgi:thioredoxin reductase (NADPH)
METLVLWAGVIVLSLAVCLLSLQRVKRYRMTGGGGRFRPEALDGQTGGFWPGESGQGEAPLLSADLETTVPGIYIAGELGGHGLIKDAVSQGRRAVEAIAAGLAAGDRARVSPAIGSGPGPAGPAGRSEHDLIIVGAGPAGLSAALTARMRGLDFLVIDQQEPGGTILQYPRRKLVALQPVDLPLFGRLPAREYAKEDLLRIWQDISRRYALPLHTGERLLDIRHDGLLEVLTTGGAYRARNVMLALGRRGTPRKLGVAGEDLAKVAYHLLDARSYQGCRLLVVGGGDSAVEAAILLAQQPGNEVTLVHREPNLIHIKHANASHLQAHLRDGSILFLAESRVMAIEVSRVQLMTPGGRRWLANDYLFIFIGGIPPFALLHEIGIGFRGPPQRDPEPTPG